MSITIDAGQSDWSPMEFGNVLVIGNSGTGKSTLINAVLGEESAKTGGGTSGVTDRLEIYESKDPKVPFRIIDTIGFEPSFLKRRAAIKAVRKWSKDAAKDGNTDNDINVIWFCVEGTARKLFPDAIKSLSRATELWKSVPVIVVITKSYSQPERADNIKMIQHAFSQEKRFQGRDVPVIPVVAKSYFLTEDVFAPPEGITELIDATNSAMPEGRKAAKKDIAEFKLQRKRSMAHGVVAACTAAGTAIGAAPIPFADAAVLTPLEVGEINALAAIYGLKKGEESKKFLDTIVEVGTVSAAAKAAISALKAIPGLGIAISVLNAAIAGSIVAAIGEGSIYAFEKVYTGEKTLEDIDWLRKIIESKLSKEFVEKATKVIEEVAKGAKDKDPIQLVSDLIVAIFSDSNAKEG